MNLFSKASKLFQKTSILLTTIEQSRKVYPDEVTKIHHAFEIAADELLIEAKQILEKSSDANFEKAKRLNKIGFIQAQEAAIANRIIDEKKNAKKTYELVLYYKVAYPTKQFITESQVKQICEKWNLVKGNISQFKGFVPEKNLQEIESFNLKKEDVGLALSNGLFLKNAKVAKLNSFWHIYETNNAVRYAFQSGDGISFYSDDSRNIFNLNHLGNINFNVLGEIQICAPSKDMDTKGYYQSEYNLIKYNPDPVVLRPVNGGYLVVTKWGDEASDENLNQNNN